MLKKIIETLISPSIRRGQGGGLRRGLVAGLLLCCLGVAAVPPQWAVDTLAGKPYMRHASLGVAVMDIATGEMVAGHDVDCSEITASTMKTVASLTALETLGADYRFATPVWTCGKVDRDGTLHGDLMVTGSGDPAMASRYIKQDSDLVQQIVAALQRRGIKRVKGCLRVDGALYGNTTPYQVDWCVDDLAWDYGAGVHSFNWRDNLIELSLDVDRDGIAILYTTPSVPGLTLVDNTTVVARGNTLDCTAGYGVPTIVVHGEVDRRHHGFTAANPLPTALFEAELRAALERAGIPMGEQPGHGEGRELLLTHHSPTVAEIIRSLLDRSDNMFAHSLLRAVAVRDSAYLAARAAGEAVDLDAAGVAAVKRCLKGLGIDTAPLFMRDGSGLARANKSSARFFADMLRVAENRTYAGGVKLRHLMPQAAARVGEPLTGSPLAGEIVLKSGSMSDVQCFVGYWPADEPRYTWATLVNNYTCPRRTLRAGLGQLLVNLFGPKPQNP